MKWPLDKTAYSKDPRSVPIHANLPDGGYVYVRDLQGIIHVVPDSPHLHPMVLGGGQAALYAGDLTIHNGKVKDVTNLSGTFGFEDPVGLLEVAEEMGRQGLDIELDAIRFFPADGSYPVILG